MPVRCWRVALEVPSRCVPCCTERWLAVVLLLPRPPTFDLMQPDSNRLPPCLTTNQPGSTFSLLTPPAHFICCTGSSGCLVSSLYLPAQ